MTLISKKYVIAGGGLAGLAAYSALAGEGAKCILEKENKLLGHAGSHKYMNNYFDEGVHVCHSTNAEWLSILDLSDANYVENSDVKNIDNGIWIGYPVQNNLADLSLRDRTISLEQLRECSSRIFEKARNYEDWLRNTYGEFLYQRYYRRFTLKYWRSEPRELGVDWLEGRLLPVQMELVEAGLSKERVSQAVFSSYYYPATGGFQQLFTNIIESISEDDVYLNSRASSIDLKEKVVKTFTGETFSYERLIYTLPLPLLPELIDDFPSDLSAMLKKLRYTRLFTLGVEVVGVNVEEIPDWFYVYDEDIDVSRVFNVSKASGSVKKLVLQCETYRRSDEAYIEADIERNMLMGMRKIFGDTQVKPLLFHKTEYAYIVPLDLNSDVVLSVSNYLEEFDVTPAGLYGLWRYRWSDQTYIETQELIRSRFLSG